MKFDEQTQPSHCILMNAFNLRSFHILQWFGTNFYAKMVSCGKPWMPNLSMKRNIEYLEWSCEPICGRFRILILSSKVRVTCRIPNANSYLITQLFPSLVLPIDTKLSVDSPVQSSPFPLTLASYLFDWCLEGDTLWWLAWQLPNLSVTQYVRLYSSTSIVSVHHKIA